MIDFLDTSMLVHTAFPIMYGWGGGPPTGTLAASCAIAPTASKKNGHNCSLLRLECDKIFGLCHLLHGPEYTRVSPTNNQPMV